MGDLKISARSLLLVPSHTGTCATSSGLRIHVTSVGVSALHLGNAGGVTKGSLVFAYTYDLYSGATKVAHCTWLGSGSVTRTGTSSFSISGMLAKGEGSTALCPGEGTFAGDFDLDDEFGGAAHID